MKRVKVIMMAMLIAAMHVTVMAASDAKVRQMHVQKYNGLDYSLPTGARVVYDKAKAGIIEYQATDEIQSCLDIKVKDGQLVCALMKGTNWHMPGDDGEKSISDVVIYTYGALGDVKASGLGSLWLDENILKIQPRLEVTGVGAVVAPKVRAMGLSIVSKGTGAVTIKDLKLNDHGCFSLRNTGVASINVGLSGSVANMTIDNRGTGVVTIGSDFKVTALHVQNSGTSKLTIKGAEVDNLTVQDSGIGRVELIDVGADVANLRSSGTGKIVIKGTADRITVQSNGAGTVDCLGLAAKSCSVRLSGVGLVKVRKSENLTINKNDFGKIVIGDDGAN